VVDNGGFAQLTEGGIADASSAQKMEAEAIHVTHSIPNKSKKKRRKGKGKGRSKKPSKYADKCMYAELLEMCDPSATTAGHTWSSLGAREGAEDGLPNELDIPGAWVAVAPVPKGKRCLAVTYQASSGGAGKLANAHVSSLVTNLNISL
jgi:snurportin-1